MNSEQRAKFAKLAASQSEYSKIVVRRMRQKCLDDIKKLSLTKDDGKKMEKTVQVHTDKACKDIEDILKQKQTELSSA